MHSRSATIFALIKGGPRDSWNVDDYRGISIVDTLGKYLEKIVYIRFKTLCIAHISVTQSGGLARNGSVQQLIHVVESVECCLSATDFNERGEEFSCNSVVLALLDCSKAFDRMFRPLLFLKIHRMGVRGKLFRFLVSYFHGRRQRVRVGSCHSDYVETTLGGPQGSVIVLFVWLVYVKPNKFATVT